MSISIKKILQFPQAGLDCVTNDNSQPDNEFKLLGGVLKDTRYAWQAKGPFLEVRNTKTVSKVGAWVFGGILKDSNTKIVCVEELQRPNSRISLLVVGIECTISGGIICIFDIFSSKVIRAIQIKEKISCLHVIDPGIEDLNLPGPLRNFDGILAVGTDGGDVILIDICRQICEESLNFHSKRDELNPSQIVLLTPKHMSRIEHYKERSVRDGNHLGIHLNTVFENRTEHFVLKGPNDDDRIHVNKEEVLTSAIYYCTQLTSLLVGYNFGAFQLWDLTTLKLVYTSPVCEEHIPVTHFALQEPTDDPRAFCYVWVSYSNIELFQTGLPFAVMYALCYESKEYHEGYGYLYQDFHYCNIRFQIELGHVEEPRCGTQTKGGYCFGIQPITKLSANKECFSHSATGDTLALCLISWTIWFSKSDTQTCSLVFDLNQWYKEQMPSFTKWKDCNNYILRTSLSDLVAFNGHKQSPTLSVLLDENSLTQFMGVQKLEEHFLPTSLSFLLWILRESDIILLFSQGLQKSLLAQIESAGPLCLIRPTDVCRQAITLGLVPLFVDIPPNKLLSLEMQREVVLNVALEHQLIHWLCKCASEWANGSFSSAGCSLDVLITWAFQRAIILKTNCDKFCSPLFDYSQSKLDANTSILLNSCTRQIANLCILYKHIIGKLNSYVSCLDLIKEDRDGLEIVSVYFEVIQWLVNVGLLPECHPSTYPRPDNSERISAPYPVQELTEYYNEKRAELRFLNKEGFHTNDSLLFIDNLINRKCGGSKLQTQWQEDGGNGLYPPPSLQSLVRTYLVNGVDISNKHSLVIYLFLDLAMALDQNRYPSVVTHLIKFPAVFKVSASIIKITQAFWQLDHGDFTTAMEQLLDPFVLSEDLQPWHHTIAMRSLLIHKQPNFALLYLQIRKPPISDEKDVMIAISLFIANNMLDEAFYFKKQHQSNNEEKLLTHLFQECNKNEALHLILYKCLNTEEEKTYFKYLKSVQNPTSDDLQIFYYLLRSRFMEAFDTHSDKRRNCHDRQGLIGQSLATKTDQIVKIFKTLLPDINKKLVEYVSKERNNLWKEVQRPTPMSVFVHNTKEQVQYKSTLIHAALAKAKHTFQNSFNVSCKELKTEDTPFLRTPTICKNGKRIITPVITSKIIDPNDTDEDGVPSPCKRMKLSPRVSITSPYSPVRTSFHQITLTPIVKRKISFQQDQSSHSLSNVGLCTPQSILKVRQLVSNRDSITDGVTTDEEGEYPARADTLLQSTSLRIQPRASLSQTSKRQHVQFDEATRFSCSLSDQSGKNLETTSPEDFNKQRSLSSKDISLMLSSSDKNEGSNKDEVSDEVFYSPDNSANNLGVRTETNIEEIQVVEKMEITPPKEIIDTNLISLETESVIRSPRGRKSYKRSLGELSPTRSSPRLSKIYSKKEDGQNDSNSTESIVSEKLTSGSDSMSTDSLSPKQRIIPKVKGKKSLSRQVLEHNTFLKINKEDIVTKEVSMTKSETITLTEKSIDHSRVVNVESNLNTVDTWASDRNTSNTSHTHLHTNSFSKKQSLDKSIYSDSSDSFQFEEQSVTELSQSLQEYIDKLRTKKCEMSKVELEFNDEPEELSNVESSEIQKDKEIEEIKILEEPLHEELNKDDECVIIDPQEEKEENPSGIFAILTPVQIEINTQNIANDEDLASSDVCKNIYEDYRELSNEESFNELEENIFGLTGTQSEPDTSSDSDNSNESNPKKTVARVALNITETYDDNDVVVITSSEDDESSSNSSSQTEESEDNFNLNISYDPNIDENSAYSKTTEEYRDDSSLDHSNDALDEAKLEIDQDDDVMEVAFVQENENDKKLVIDEQLEKNVVKKIGQDSSILEQIQIEETILIDQNVIEKTAIEQDNLKITLIKEVLTPTNRNVKKSINEDQKEKNQSIVTVSEKKSLNEDQKEETQLIVTSSENVSKSDKEVLTVTDENLKKPMNEEHKDEIVNKEHVVEKKSTISEKIPTLETRTAEKLQKVDHSTNTTILEDEQTVIEEDKISEEQKTDKNVIEHTEKNKKQSEDQTTSSSDTTEGETFRKEIITVQIHTPNNSSKNKEEHTPSKRVTRKASALSQAKDVDIESVVSNNEDKKDSVIEIDCSMETQDKESILGTTMGQFSFLNTPVKKITRRLSTHGKIDCDPNTSLKIIEDNVVLKLAKRKKRSASMKEVRTFSRDKKQNASTDEYIGEGSVEKKAQSVAQVPVSSKKESGNSNAKTSRKTKSVVESYTTSRRLTRRQASIVKDITTEETHENRPNISLEVEDLDPINLLDKASFEGYPDPDEKRIYEPSSPSSSTTTSVQKRKGRSRSNSVMSEVSTSPSQNQPQTPKRGGRSTRSQTKSPVTSRVSTRSRKYSETSSVVSGQTESSTPPKRPRKKKLDIDDVGSAARSTRSRTASVSSAKSAESNSVRKLVKAKRVVSAKSDLADIKEERGTENVNEVTAPSKKKQTRKKT